MSTFFDSLKKWFYTKNSSAASSDARVPLLDASGNPKGSDTMANLASVLGEQYSLFKANEDLNNFYANGWWETTSTAISLSLLNKPSGLTSGNFQLKVQEAQGFIIQTFYAEGAMWFRTAYNTVWTDWYKYSVDIPTFYKDYSDLSSLANALGSVRRITINNGDDIVISKRSGGSAILALSESMLEGLAFLGRVAYTMASITNLVPSGRTIGWGISSEEQLVLYYDSSFNLHMKYNGSRSQLQIEVLTLE